MPTTSSLSTFHLPKIIQAQIRDSRSSAFLSSSKCLWIFSGAFVLYSFFSPASLQIANRKMKGFTSSTKILTLPLATST